MTQVSGRTALVLAALLTLGACAEGQAPLGFLKRGQTDAAGGGAPADATGASVRLVENDVEAPDVFQVTDSGLWDGRPSLGGVWVAAPDVKDPERVIIRNTDNGKFVIGALFRRERDNPGPKLQVSSDAAEALGMLAGQPGQINVTALRREEAPPEALPAPAPEALISDPAMAATDLAPAGATADTGADAAPLAAAEAAIAEVEQAAAPLPDAPAPRQSSMAADDAMAPGRDAPAVIGAEGAAAAPSAADRPADRPAAMPALSAALEKPYIQIGIFSQQANADKVARELRGAAVPVEVVGGTSQGKAFWRVVVGPASTTEARAGLLAKVKDQGYGDAYYVTN